MQNLQTLDTSQLIDLLNKETTRYYKIIKDGSGNKERIETQWMINNIQKDLNQRKKVTR